MQCGVLALLKLMRASFKASCCCHCCQCAAARQAVKRRLPLQMFEMLTCTNVLEVLKEMRVGCESGHSKQQQRQAWHLYCHVLALLKLMPASLLLLPLLARFSHQAVKRRLPLSVETCPHYLLFSAEQIADGDTKFKCAPPLRDEQNRWAQVCCRDPCCCV
jgi:hypothetical protein